MRYLLGTVVPLPQGGRWLFAVAYSRQENDLAGTSDGRTLRSSLEQLWTAVARRGQLKPVAIALVGSKLARVNDLDRRELAILIIETFLRARWNGAAVAPELRLVLMPGDVNSVDVPGVARYVDSLDQDGGTVTGSALPPTAPEGPRP